ncbi:hypothetical protein [Paraburkholderia dioscoreae]|uniref:Uncharacterized protein n=1 Tax=Paraburkholderia dioscoreae TaxID=2604047 RepID=A0A5Q4ZD63_9BURK|nr:hypothetical protein [Paraburkholderia dioscoreae]VVD29137.1 conserved protein of unknown function [Paraburkholderia dioscoreae]
MKLPKFTPPSLADLRKWWSKHRREREVQTLILEVQYLRLLLLDLREMADDGVRLAREADKRLVGRDSPIMGLRIRLAQEVLRIGEIDDTPPLDAPRSVREYQRPAEALAYERGEMMRRRKRQTAP